MFTRLQNSWLLFQQCFAILRSDLKLMWFPVLSGLACLLVVISFAVPVGLYVVGKAPARLPAPAAPDPVPGAWEADAAPGLDPFSRHTAAEPSLLTPGEQAAGLALLFIFYLVNFFVVVFFNTALASCVIARFKGVDDVTMMDGLRMAGARLPQIFGWAILSATVGTILKAIEERLGWLGKIVTGLLGTAWAVGTYLVVPTLVVEGLGPLDATRRSVGLIRKCWGEGLAGHIGMNAISGMAMLVIFIVTLMCMFLAIAAGGGMPYSLFVIFGLAALATLTVAIVMSTLGQIYVSGLYLFAAEGRVPDGLSEAVLRGAFKPKSASSLLGGLGS